MSDLCEISPELADWILAQPLFFNATAPLNPDGHINLSPRGLDSLRVVDATQLVILDLGVGGSHVSFRLLVGPQPHDFFRQRPLGDTSVGSDEEAVIVERLMKCDSIAVSESAP